MVRALALGGLVLAACRPSRPPPASIPADTGCVIRGTVLRDTLIPIDAESLTVVTAVGLSVRLRHAIDYHQTAVFPGDVVVIWCHAQGRSPIGRTMVDTVVDSLDVAAILER